MLRHPLIRLLFAGSSAGLLACSSDIALTGTAASMVVSPSLLDLGAVPVGAGATGQVTLSAAEGTVNVLGFEVLNIDGDYVSLPDDSLPSIAEGEPYELSVDYQPGLAGFHWAELHILTDEGEGEEHVVQVRGEAAEGLVRAWPVLIDFGPVAIGDVGTGAFTLSNEGGLDLTVQAISSNDASFSVSASLPLDLPAGVRVDVPLAFAPVDEDAASATLTVNLGDSATVSDIGLRANDCATASGALYDQDGDGVGWCGGDCDDTEATVKPGGTETCNGVDDDCDGTIDEATECSDDDGDGYSEEEGDCHDADAGIGPEIEEDLTNGVDDDCDGVVDLGSTDGDGDGFAEEGGDCDDEDPAVYPGAPETADGVDEDCDDTIDEGTSASDDDGDGYSEEEGDCDDTDDEIGPDATEIANWYDDDCDGTIDEGTDYADDDGDGFSELGGDCDDDDASANPGEPEVEGDGIDNDCDGVEE